MPSWFKLSQKTAPYYFLAPTILTFLIFMAYPIANSVVLSLQMLENGKFVFTGLNNYVMMFKDPMFYASLRNTFIYLIVQVPVMVATALVLAVLIEQKFVRGKAFFRMGIFLPSITALVAYSIVFKLLLNTDYGLVNYVLGLFGVEKIRWLTSPIFAKVSIIAAITWRWTGYNMIIMIAGLQGISESVYEAAEIDGASAWQRFLFITVPMMKPIILFCAITSTIGTLQLFDESYVLTKGGPDNATITTGHYLYINGFTFLKLGYAAAISYVIVFITAAFSFLQFRLTKERD